MTPSELRAAAEQVAIELQDICPREEIDLDCVRTMVDHILATVPADTKLADDAITVALLESWGGVVRARRYIFDARDNAGTDHRYLHYRVDVHEGKAWVETCHESGAWTLISPTIASATDLRKLLELLGCKLKG